MSLINQMLQELDSRGNQTTLGGVLQGQVRAVPQRRSLALPWWALLALVCAACAIVAWGWLSRMAPTADPRAVSMPVEPSVSMISLKIDQGLGRAPESSPQSMAAMPQEPSQAKELPVSSEPDLPTPSATTRAASHAQESAVTAAAMSSAKAAALNEDSQPKRGLANPVEPRAMAAAAKESQAVIPASTPNTIPVNDTAVIAKQVKELTPRQLAENEYRKASNLIQQGRSTEALNSLEQALQLDSRHAEARQTLAALLIQMRRQDEAIRILREGLQIDVSQSGLAMILARLQLERGEVKSAIDTLQRSLPHAVERADYQAFLAALLQRDGRHREAIDYYTQALRKSPGNSVWWMGQGISLQAENRIPEAIEAFKRAKAGSGLSAELKAFVEDRLNSL